MTQAQVRFALGSPLIVDAFRTDRWDYMYMLQRQGKPVERRNLTVIFENDKLLRLEGDVTAVPPAAKPAAEKSQPPAAPAPGAKSDAQAERPVTKPDQPQ
jgi:outer membrane protein assembly factor BamE